MDTTRELYQKDVDLRRAYERTIQQSDRLILRGALYKFQKQRPFTKNNYREMYAIAKDNSDNELRALWSTDYFTEEELNEFDKIVCDDLNIDSAIARTIKDNPGKSGFEILALL